MPCVFPYRPEVPNGDQCFSTKYGYFPILAKGPPCLVVHRPLTSTSSLLNKPGEVEFVKRLVVTNASVTVSYFCRYYLHITQFLLWSSKNFVIWRGCPGLPTNGYFLVTSFPWKLQRLHLLTRCVISLLLCSIQNSVSCYTKTFLRGWHYRIRNTYSFGWQIQVFTCVENYLWRFSKTASTLPNCHI